MGGNKILILGGTGLAGVCLLRELVHRNHEIVVFARNPSKIPEEISSKSLVEVVKGDMGDVEALSTAVSKCHTVLSLLGPVVLRAPADGLFVAFYRTLFELMRQHGVRRIFAMGTLSIYRPEDDWSLQRWATVWLVRLVAPYAAHTISSLRELFDGQDGALSDMDWTVFRVGYLPGSSDEASWRVDREDGKTHVGSVAQPGWSTWQKRAALARWMVDVAESGAPELIGQMPAVSRDSRS